MTIEEFATAKGFTPDLLRRYGVRAGLHAIEIPYYNADGSECPRLRLRASLEDGKGFTWSAGEEKPTWLYGLHRPVPYDKGTVIVVEGESDCWALWACGIPALGVPGASNTMCVDTKDFAGVERVLVVQEPGNAGASFPHKVALRLYDTGFTGEVSAISLEPHKDPRAAYAAVGNKLRETIATAAKKRFVLERPKAVTDVDDSESAMELLSGVEVEIDWLVEGLIPRKGIALCSAAPKAGKSVLARNLALMVSRGGTFLGRSCSQGTVLWIALEEGKENVKAAMRCMGMTENDPIRFRFGRPVDAVKWIERQCTKRTIDLLVIDTWHKFTRIENINDYAAVNNANAPLRDLAAHFGVTQLWIHHNNKGNNNDGSEVLGSTALFAEVDTLLTMRRAPDDVRTAKTIQRVGSDMEEIVIEMDLDTELISSPGSRYVVQLDHAKEAIKTFLVEHPNVQKGKILDHIEGRAKTVRAALKSLVGSGDVKQHGSGLKGEPHTYSLGERATFKRRLEAVPNTAYDEPGWVIQKGPVPHHGPEQDQTQTFSPESDEDDDLMRYAEKRINEV